MSNAVATVAFLQGQAWAKAPDGSLRPLSVGSVLNDDEVLVTAQGAQVQLDFGNGDPVTINGGQEVAMSRDFNDTTAASADEALLDGASIDEALTVLEQGGDLLDELEETAAGNNGGGGGSDGGNSFVRLTRTLESTDPLAFNYQSSPTNTTGDVENDAGNSNYINRAPDVTDQALSGNEDETITGQIIASDIEGDTISYTLTTAPVNGALVLNPVTGQFTFTPNANYNGSDSFVVTVTDSRGNTSTTTVNLTIVPVNDAPTTSDIDLTTDEDTPVSGQVVAQDIEGDSLTYIVSGQPASGAVTLDPATGAFVYTPNPDFNGSDSFVVTISDGNGGTTTSTVRIGVNPVNDVPVSNDQNLTTPEDTPIDGQVTASDVDGDTLAYAISTQPANGTVALNPVTGGFTYTPNANYNGSDSFVVTISDGKGGTTTSTITIGVTPVNDAPVSSDQNLTTPEDTAISGQVGASDVDGDTLTYAVSGQPANGLVTLNPATGVFTYTPNANYNGSDSFIVTISDGNGGTTTSRINIGVTPVNDAPTSSNVSLITPENTPISGQVNASDIDGDTLSFSIGGNPAHGTVVLNPATGSFTYTPNVGYNGSDSFTVTVSDGNGGTTTSVVTIGVTPVNDAPTAANVNLTTDENVPVNGAISANDPDGDTLSYSVTGNPANGTVVLNPATGTFTYTPNSGYTGGDSFVVTVSDGNGGVTTSTVTIGVNPVAPVNQIPVAVDDAFTVIEGGTLTVTAANKITLNDTDADGDPLTAILVTGPTNGTLTLNADGTFTYIHDGSETTSDSFTYKVNDGTADGNIATVTINVTPINDAPVSVADSITVAEGGTATVLVGGATSVLANDSDAENDPLSAVLVSGPTNGTLTLNADGTFSYTHNGSETTTDSFTYRANDGTLNGNIVTVQIVVTPVNDAPIANNDVASVDEGSSITIAVRGNDTDAEGGSLTIDSVSQGAHGSVVIDAVTGNPIYTPDSGFIGTDSFTYTVRDDDGAISNTATVTVTVNPVNHAPVAVDDVFTVNEGGTLTVTAANKITLNDTDADGDSLTAILVSGPSNGSLTLNADGTFTYVHDGSETTVDSFTYKVNDGTVDGSIATVTINVTPVNDAPVAVDDAFVIDEDTPLVISPSQLLANDTDAENNPLTIVTIQSATNGTLSVIGGNIVFTPTLDYSGPASFRYTISDGKGGFSTGTVNITVNPVNDPTVMTPETVSVAEDSFIDGNVLTNDFDPDDLLSIHSYAINGVTYLPGSTANIAGIGSFLLMGNGDYEFTPDANYNGPVPVISYTTNTGASSTLTITVTPMNDLPVATDDSFSVGQNSSLTISPSQLLANDYDIDGDSLSVSTIFSITNGTVSIIGGNIVFTPTPGYSGPASFRYSVSDGKGGFDSATVNITVTPPAAVPPVTNDVSVSGDEDTLISITLSGSDSDGTVVGYVIKSLPANGLLYSDAAMTTLVNIGDLVTGPVYFNPTADWNGNTSFSYTAKDSQGLEDATPATVNITVNPVADPALIGSGSGSVKEDTPAQTTASGTLTISDADAGEASFNARTNSPGTYGYFSIDAAGNWTYAIDNTNPAVQQLKEGEIRQDSFSVTSQDGTSTTVTITVIGTNDGPVAVADTASVNQNAVLTLTPAQLLANDTDVDGDSLSITSVQGATHGSVSLVGGNVVFTPTAGYHGPASFTYTASDGNGGTATATVNVTVVKPNTPPDAVDDSAAPSFTSTGFFSEYFGYNEGTHGANLTNINQVYDFMNGRTPDATFTAKTFDYGANFTAGNNLGFGTNLQTFLGSDAGSLSADPATTTDAIIRMRGFMQLGAGTYNFKVLGDDGYQILVDGVVVAERNINQSATTTIHNPFTLATGGLHHVEIVYWDQGNYARLKVELSDDGGSVYNLISTVPNYSASAFSAVEDTPLNIAAATLLANDTDADGDTLSITSVQGVVNGTVSMVGGNITFTPAANYSGPASFTYTISDGKGGSDTATVNLTIAPVNDAPVAVNDTAKTGMNTAVSIPVSTLLANDTDVEGNPLNIVSVQGATNGAVSLSGNNVVFTPTNNFEGIATFTYTIRDTAGATSTATVNVTVGSATTPSLVVSKSLVAVAHGTGGTSVKFPIITKLVDTDGSESLTIKISNVPTNLSFNAGTNLGGGVWQFTEADLPNLTLNLPGSYTTLATNLTVQVTSTEMYGGATASVSSVVTLKAAYTTVDITTTESGNYTGSSANEFVQGGNGNNTINAGSGNNIVYGGAGDDNLSAAAGSDIFYGGSGNDTINAGSGSDRISGGSGNDILIGGDAGENFVDVFIWSLGDQGAAGTPAVDTIKNFATAAANNNTSGGDVLDLRDLLQGESVGPSNGAGNLANYLHFEISGGNTYIHISHTGGFSADSHSVGGSFTSSAETQTIVLEGVNLQSVYSGATTDQQIITQLLNNNKLITD